MLAVGAVLVLSACSASVSVDGDAESSATPDGSASAASVAPSASSAVPSSGASPSTAWAVVSDGISFTGEQHFTDAAGFESTLVAVGYTVVSETDWDVIVAYSEDAGANWKSGGTIVAPGRQQPRSVMLVDGGAVIVGTDYVELEAGGSESAAFFAVASTPGFVPEQVVTPPEFATPTTLVGIESVDGTWVIGGDAYNVKQNALLPAIWTSEDLGQNWQQTWVTAEGADFGAVYGFSVALDGSWNILGSSAPAAATVEADATWWQSTDEGVSWNLVEPTAFDSADYQSIATSAIVATDGGRAVLGYSYTAQDAPAVSALWAAGSGQDLVSVGATIPVEGGTPEGAFLDGILFDGVTLVGWGTGSAQGLAEQVQFWAWDSEQFVPTVALPGDGELIFVGQVLSVDNSAMAFGTSGPDAAGQSLTIWRAS